MKKIYQNPVIKVVKIQTQQMIAGSDKIGLGSNYSGGAVQSRRQEGDFWADEEDEY